MKLPLAFATLVALSAAAGIGMTDGAAAAATAAPNDAAVETVPVALDDAAVDQAVGESFGSAETLRPAFEALAYSVAADDREGVAALVRYPLTVELGGKKRVIRGPRQFVSRYEQLITAPIAATIVGQDYADLTVDDDGVSYDDGTLHLIKICIDRRCRRNYWLIDALDG